MIALLLMAMVLLVQSEALGDLFKRYGYRLTKSQEVLDLVGVTGELLAWVPLLLSIPFVFRLASHYGGAEWGPWGVWVVDLFSGQRGTHLPWQQVESLKEIPGGLRVVPAPAAGKLFRIGGPTLIVPPGEDRERLLQATAPFVGRHFEPQVFGAGPRAAEWGTLWVLVGLYLPAAVWACVESTRAAWGQPADGLSLSCILVGALACCVFGYLAVLSRSSRVELYEAEGYPTLLRVFRTAIPLAEIKAVRRQGQALWIEATNTSGGIRIQDPAEAEALVSALERLGLDVGEGLPAWKRPRLRVPLCWVLAVLSLVIGFVPALWAEAVPAHRASRLSDEYGQDVLLVWEERSYRPLLFLALPPETPVEVRGLRGAYGLPDEARWSKEEGLVVDVAARTWTDLRSGASGSLALVGSATTAATTSHSRISAWSDDPASLRGLEPYLQDSQIGLVIGNTLTLLSFGKARKGKATRDLPELSGAFAKVLQPEPGPLADFVAGRSSRRIYDLRGITPDKDLVAAVVHGRVVWAVLVPRDTSQTLRGAGLTYDIGKGGNLVALTRGLWRVHVGGALSLIRAEPPTLAELRELEARLAEGAPEGEELLERYSR